ncbi:MAG TPA: hypothetical protein VNF27_04890 [Candidatus Binataceae bacterium]|nr:hypothetical protein [Candidatus Binataceae bacterium]
MNEMGGSPRIVRALMLLLTAIYSIAAPAPLVAQESTLPTAPRAYYKVVPLSAGVTREMVRAAVASSATIPMWDYTITSPLDGNKYPGSMVGRSPFFHGARTTGIPAIIVPIVIDMSDGGVFDPTATDPACSPAGKALTLTQESPIFQLADFTMGGTDVGAAQYVDAFERASFWSNVSATGNRYHTVLSPVTTLSAVTVKVPSADGITNSAATYGGCGKIGTMNINWWDPYVQSTIMPSLVASGLSPTTLPIFLFYNVVMTEGTPSLTGSCCILGYHGAAGFPVQTYSTVDYDTTRIFSGTGDISVMSHEVGEWMDDPLGTNPTPAWGNIGQVTGCQNNLEVGDPLSGTLFPGVAMPNGYTYHPQELAFFSWFYRQSPSIGVNDWYSDNHTFTDGQPLCN